MKACCFSKGASLLILLKTGIREDTIPYNDFLDVNDPPGLQGLRYNKSQRPCKYEIISFFFFMGVEGNIFIFMEG